MDKLEDKVSRKDKVNATGNILYLYQPTGVEDYSTSQRLFIGEVDGKLIKTSISRGVHEMRAASWNMLMGDEKAVSLMTNPRQLIKIADGDILPRDIIKVSGIYGSIGAIDAIVRTYQKALLEKWQLWLKNDGISHPDHTELLAAITNQIEALDKGEVELPTYSTEFPGAKKSNVASII